MGGSGWVLGRLGGGGGGKGILESVCFTIVRDDYIDVRALLAPVRYDTASEFVVDWSEGKNCALCYG